MKNYSHAKTQLVKILGVIAMALSALASAHAAPFYTIYGDFINNTDQTLTKSYSDYRGGFPFQFPETIKPGERVTFKVDQRAESHQRNVDTYIYPQLWLNYRIGNSDAYVRSEFSVAPDNVSGGVSFQFGQYGYCYWLDSQYKLEFKWSRGNTGDNPGPLIILTRRYVTPKI